MRKIAACGRILEKGAIVTIGHALAGEWIGIEAASRMWHLSCAPVRLGFLAYALAALGLIRPSARCGARGK